MIITVLIFFSYVHLAHLDNNACKHLSDYYTRNTNLDCYFNPDVDLTTPEIIRNHGFPVESHFVTTRDGYILQLFRIPSKSDKPVIFLEHGILTDSSCFIFVGNRSLGLSLAADGYEVWLGNYRGSLYSRGHKTFNTSNEKYWDFTLDTVVDNDIPVSLEKVATISQKAIIYVGHSRGALLGLMYVAANPQDKFLKGVIPMAPVVYLDPKMYIKFGATLGDSVKQLFGSFGQWALFQDPEITHELRDLCLSYPKTCQYNLMLFSGESDQFLPDDLLNMISHSASAFSFKEYIHFTQLISAGRSQKFDYGMEKNLKVYGQANPPIYDLGKIKIPVDIFYVRHDVFVSEKSVLRQFRDLGSTKKGIFKIPIGIDDEKLQWGHLDFLYGKDLQEYLYQPLKRVLEEKYSALV